MTHVELVGYAAAIITTVYTAFGLPVQVYKNFTKRSVDGLSLVMTAFMLLTFTSWVIYGFVKPEPDYFVIVSNFPGAVCATLLLVQFGLYKNTAATAGDSKPPSVH